MDNLAQKNDSEYSVVHSMANNTISLHNSNKLNLFHAFKRAMKNIRRSIIPFLIPTLMQASVLFVLVSSIVLYNATSGYLGNVKSNFAVRLFLKDNVTSEEMLKLQTKIQSEFDVSDIVTITKEDAFKELRNQLGDKSSLLDGFNIDNPLPNSLEVKFRQDKVSEILYREFASKYADNPAVQSIAYDSSIVSILSILTKRLYKLGAVLVCLLVIGVVVVTSLISYLVFIIYKEEIGVMKLLGATESFIFMPYVIEGAIQGLVSSCLAVFLSWISIHNLSNLIFSLKSFSNYDFFAISAINVVFILILGIFMGAASSYFAARIFFNKY